MPETRLEVAGLVESDQAFPMPMEFGTVPDQLGIHCQDDAGEWRQRAAWCPSIRFSYY